MGRKKNDNQEKQAAGKPAAKVDHSAAQNVVAAIVDKSKPASEYQKHMAAYESKAEKKAEAAESEQDLALKSHPKFAKFNCKGAN